MLNCGSVTKYKYYGCRCSACTNAHRLNMAKYRKKSKVQDRVKDKQEDKRKNVRVIKLLGK